MASGVWYGEDADHSSQQKTVLQQGLPLPKPDSNERSEFSTVIEVGLSRAGSAKSIVMQHHAQISLKHVDSLPDAKQFLQSLDKTIEWYEIDNEFFKN